jgi:hypothetical protein
VARAIAFVCQFFHFDDSFQRSSAPLRKRKITCGATVVFSGSPAAHASRTIIPG